MGDTDSTSSNGPITPLATGFRTFGIMPCPGQPGAMLLDGNNVTEFLDEWNIECEDFGLSEAQRCVRFPNYCTP